MITFKQFLKETSMNAVLVAAIMKDLNVDKTDAKETLAWLRDESGADLPDDAYNGMTALFDDKLSADDGPQHEDVEEYLQQWMNLHLKTKYRLDTGWKT